VKIFKETKNFLLIAVFYFSPVWAAETFDLITPRQSSQGFLLPPVRRVGVDLVETNVDKLRSFMRKQDFLLQGFVALPFHEWELKKKLSEDLVSEMKQTGRFWDLSLTDFMKALEFSKISQIEKQKIINLKKRLEKDYHLDAWMKAMVYFSPDQTLVRLSLTGSGAAGKVWVREDVTLGPLPSQSQLKNSLSKALIRIIQTLGHDGKITSFNENLFTIDFGQERGLVRGETLLAGYLVLSSFHPQTGEFLISKRVPLHELRVLESRMGSSLCQLIASDKIIFDHFSKTLGPDYLKTKPVLVWKKPVVEKQKETWRQIENPFIAPYVGAAQEGFALTQPEVEVLPENSGVSNTKAGFAPVLALDHKKSLEQNASFEKKAPLSEVFKDPSNAENAKQEDAFKPLNSWLLYRILFGAGTSFGILSENRFSRFPNTLMNLLYARGDIDLDVPSGIKMFPYFKYTFFNVLNSVKHMTVLGSAFLSPVVRSSSTEQVSLGGALEIQNGTIDYSTSSQRNTSQFKFFLNALWEKQNPLFGDYTLSAGISLLEFVRALPLWELSCTFRPFTFLPRELSFELGMKRYSPSWMEVHVGVSWDLFLEYHYFKK
jgi:hypothetical protein